MKYRPRIYYSDAQKALMWDRWQKSDSMHAIARLLDRGHTSVQRILSETAPRPLNRPHFEARRCPLYLGHSTIEVLLIY